MEQYWMPKKLDFKNLRLCLDNYTADFLFIRLVGSAGGTVKVNEDSKGRTLDFRKNKTGLFVLIDLNEVFHFPMKDYYKGFSLAYERIEPTKDGIGRIVMLSTGVDPYDPNLPEPKRSFLRNVWDEHLDVLWGQPPFNWCTPLQKYNRPMLRIILIILLRTLGEQVRTSL